MEAVQVLNYIQCETRVKNISLLCMHITPIITGDIVISGVINFTETSSSPTSFTLTCASTGGPATTVTWTRNSEAAEGVKVTVLDDAVTAQYTHTLTVTGKLVGLYQCNVSNNKPSWDSLSLTVQGKPL